MVEVRKFHGTGNDFVVVDAAEEVPDRRAFARALCDRETGIEHPDSPRVGADGVLFLAVEDRYSPPRVVMTLVQPDGSVAAMCGNGARCAAAWAAAETGADEVMIDTQSGTRHAAVEETGVTIEMGAPSFDPADVPVEAADPLVETDVEGLTVTAVNTGVPHAVAVVDDVDAVDLAAVAPAVRYADAFPEGANVTLAAEDGDGFRQRTYERGVEGETDSCGTGAVAVAAVAHRLGLLDTGDPTRVSPPGGDLEVTIEGDGSTLRGPTAVEFRTDVPRRPSRSTATGD
ncbi:diaminopimelate epimerase [Halorarius halobius]|uniref:diaminopimelate epimerase n=1 Tax=Halorarius halobius TaxID=2962671 RepID=UPI0020CBEC0F|nr:diaminopimelate epimerase [Halorarius halobius]